VGAKRSFRHAYAPLRGAGGPPVSRRRVIVNEGKKPTEALLQAGELAVGTATGADGTPDLEVLRPLQGHSVFLERIAERLLEIGIKARRIDWADAPAKGDAADYFERGGTVEELQRLIEAAEPYYAEERRRFTFLTPDEILHRPAPEHLVDDFLLANSTSMTFGDSEPFKSFCMLDLALCVGCGYRWHSRAVKRGPVIYVSAEGGAGVHLRLRAW
jgi:AAA domain